MPRDMTVSESTLRRRAAARGLRISKVRQNSRWYHQYGPYFLADTSTRAVVGIGLDLQDLTDALTE